uniref:DEAD/DEAH box helicase family protein n=1 Tax=Alistipes senegalensis TaxID=1288121 RepID=UPI001E46A2AE
MIDLEDMDDIAAEVADIMGNGNLDLSNLNFSVLQDFPDEAEINVPPVKEEKTILVATPQLSAPTVTTKQSVPNTYKDLHDSANGWISLSAEDKAALMDQEINQLSDLPLEIGFPGNVDEIMNALEQGTPVPIPVGSDSVQLKLSFYMDKMPHGIVDKQVAGIGATSLEIDSKRNSIIVFPTKILAYNKWQRNKTKLLYVGGKINDERNTTSIKEIQSYLSDEKVVYKKFLVVADSLYKLLQIIGKEHYKDYFLMIDEVDMIQSESNYRPRLESLIDHYFEFPPKNRCLVTATMREFSNPQLQQECKFNLSWKDAPKRKIQLYYTDNLDALTAQQIQSIDKAEKIVVAFNSIRHCKNIIKLLSEETRKECTIMCSDDTYSCRTYTKMELDLTNIKPQFRSK